MTFDEIKALGAPFQAAEVQISRRRKIARLVLIVPDRDASDNPTLDFPWHGDSADVAEEVGSSVIAVAIKLELLAKDPRVEFKDLDQLGEREN